MRDCVDLGVTTPREEECAQVGAKDYDYYDRARGEARTLINPLRRIVGVEPPGARLSVKSHPHDFGNYLTVVCCYDADDPLAAAYAACCDSQCPLTWDEAARAELSLDSEERR